MLFINGYSDKERYNIGDVFREKVYYANSDTRVIAYDTPVSTFFASKNKGLLIMFKSNLLKKYGEGFKDKPFECSLPEPIYSFRKENYNSEEMKRKRFIAYALKKYKESADSFEPKMLRPSEVKDLDESCYLADKFVFVKKIYGNNGNQHFWFPVDVDSIIVDGTDDIRLWTNSSTCFLVDFQLNVTSIDLGYDKKLYSFGVRKSEETGTMYRNHKIFSVENGLKELELLPMWVLKLGLNPNLTFLRNYIVLPDDTCVTYDDVVLKDKSTHYKNVDFINRIIADLATYDVEPQKTDLGLELKINNDIKKVTPKMVENIIIPHVLSSGFLKKKSLEQFYCLCSIFKKARLDEDDFQVVYKNVREINKHPIYGGDIENVCSEKILKTIARIQGKLSGFEFGCLLKDEIALRIEVAKYQGLTIIERYLSDEELSDICWDDDKKEEFWKDIPLNSILYIRTSSTSSILTYENTDEGIEVGFV